MFLMELTRPIRIIAASAAMAVSGLMLAEAPVAATPNAASEQIAPEKTVFGTPLEEDSSPTTPQESTEVSDPRSPEVSTTTTTDPTGYAGTTRETQDIYVPAEDPESEPSHTGRVLAIAAIALGVVIFAATRQRRHNDEQ